MPLRRCGGLEAIAKTALVVIDMLLAYDHEEADLPLPSVHRTFPAVVRLLEQAASAICR